MLRNWARTVTDDGVCCYKSVFADERTTFEYLFFPGRQCHTEVSLSGNVRMSEHLEKRMGNQVREEIRFRIENGLLPIGKDAAFAESAVLKVHEIEAQRWFFRRANMDAEDRLTRFRYVAANVEFDVIMRARIEDETTGEVFLRKYIVNGACGLADREEYYGWGLIAPYTPCMRANEDMDDYMVPFLSAKQRENALHTSTCYAFLRAVMPRYAVISVGEGNAYGHPSEATLSRLSDAGSTILRTDIDGDIVFHSDGQEVWGKSP